MADVENGLDGTTLQMRSPESPPYHQESTLTTEIEADEVSDIVGQMNNFRRKRNKKMHEKFRLVFYLGLQLLFFGLCLNLLLLPFASIQMAAPIQLSFLALSLTCLAVSMVGWMIMSTVDPLKINFDDLVSDGCCGSIRSTLIRVCTVCILVANAKSYYGFYAYTPIIEALFALVVLIPEEYTPWLPKFSFKFIAYMLLDELFIAIAFFYNAEQARTRGDYADRFIPGLDTFASSGLPKGEELYGSFLAIGSFCTVEFIGFFLFCYYYLTQYFESDGKHGYSPTGVQYVSFYLFLIRYGVINLWQGTCGYYYNAHRESMPNTVWPDRSYFTNAYLTISGSIYVIPAFLIAVIGPQNLFNWTAQAFDSDSGNQKEDGSFIAALMDYINEPREGLRWWVIGDPSAADFVATDSTWPQWRMGIIEEIVGDKFKVIFDQNGDDYHWVSYTKNQIPPPLPLVVASEERASFKKSFSMSKSTREIKPEHQAATNAASELMTLAADGLRCIDREDITEDLFVTSVRDSKTVNLYSMSRYLKEGETIDYFISHSWSDDGKLKYKILSEVSQDFKSKHGRYPTFWLDKVCFDQDNLSDGLKVLPVNIMMCKQVLALCGANYTSRLWCVWEIFTLFSFSDQKTASRRLVVKPIQEGVDAIHELTSFDVTKAHCFDPNEETKIRSIIDGAGSEDGSEDFSSKIQRLADELLSKRSRRFTL